MSIHWYMCVCVCVCVCVGVFVCVCVAYIELKFMYTGHISYLFFVFMLDT